jgi:DNA-directed RNA polymerase subunit alpha
MISLPLKPKVIKKEKDKVVLEIEALYPGYGITIGNSLRRVLLSSLEGAAITQVKIKNIPHEFSTLSGVMEDMVDIILNLKQLRFKIFSLEPQKATLKVKGEKEIKGSDFKLPTQLELVNKDIHIATTTDKKSELEMEIQVEKGIGYVQAEERKKQKLGVGVIVLDAIFTPVKRVSLRVENMRVGERTDFDRLFLEIKTDGTISPEEAFSKASDILLNHFSSFSQAFEIKEKIIPKEEKKEKKPALSIKKSGGEKKKPSSLGKKVSPSAGGKAKKDEKKKKRKKT